MATALYKLSPYRRDIVELANKIISIVGKPKSGGLYSSEMEEVRELIHEIQNKL